MYGCRFGCTGFDSWERSYWGFLSVDSSKGRQFDMITVLPPNYDIHYTSDFIIIPAQIASLSKAKGGHNHYINKTLIL